MRTVMVVDDEKDLAGLIERDLRAAGYRTVYCANGVEALSCLERPGAPDLAVLDVNMPGMDGLELCQRIRANPRLSALPILMLTALTESAIQEDAYQTGADDYLSKPFFKEMLVARLKALERRTLGAGPS